MKWSVRDYVGLDGVMYAVDIEVQLPSKFKHGDHIKRLEIRRAITNRLRQEIDFSSVKTEIERIISEEAVKYN